MLIEKMSEAEVSLRLAFWLTDEGLADENIDIAIDGAQIRTGDAVHFDLDRFLSESRWKKQRASDGWRGSYEREDLNIILKIHSNPGKGDVVAKLVSGKILRVECKKGPLSRSPSSQEYPLIREALGQLLTVKEVGKNDILAVAVPHSEKFAQLATRWREAPLIKKFGILILTVARNGDVEGFSQTR